MKSTEGGAWHATTQKQNKQVTCIFISKHFVFAFVYNNQTFWKTFYYLLYIFSSYFNAIKPFCKWGGALKLVPPSSPLRILLLYSLFEGLSYKIRFLIACDDAIL